MRSAGGARRASESKRQQDAKKALTERAQLVKERESAGGRGVRPSVGRARKRRTASVNGLVGTPGTRKALSRVAAAVDASSMHQGRAAAGRRAAALRGTTPWSCCLPRNRSGDRARLAAMEKQLRRRPARGRVAALSPACPTKAGLVSPR